MACRNWRKKKLWQATISATPLIIVFFFPALASHNSFSFLFFSFFPPLHFRQLNCYNSFFFSSSFGKPHSFFSSPLYFQQLNCHNFFFLSPQFWQLDCLNSFFSISSLLQFQQLHCHNCFYFFSLFALLLGSLHFGQKFQQLHHRNSIVSLSHSLPPSHHFSLLSHIFS